MVQTSSHDTCVQTHVLANRGVFFLAKAMVTEQLYNLMPSSQQAAQLFKGCPIQTMPPKARRTALLNKLLCCLHAHCRPAAPCVRMFYSAKAPHLEIAHSHEAEGGANQEHAAHAAQVAAGCLLVQPALRRQHGGPSLERNARINRKLRDLKHCGWQQGSSKAKTQITTCLPAVLTTPKHISNTVTQQGSFRLSAAADSLR